MFFCNERHVCGNEIMNATVIVFVTGTSLRTPTAAEA